MKNNEYTSSSSIKMYIKYIMLYIILYKNFVANNFSPYCFY